MPKPDKAHYIAKEYDSFERFASYYEQIKSVQELAPKTVLEIGIGNKTVSNYLKEHGFDVTTLDFDASLKPDKVGDVRKLPFQDNSFDLVMCCQVLEHLPFSDFEKALREIARVSKKHAVISLPFHGAWLGVSFNLGIPFYKKTGTLVIKIPYFFHSFEPTKEHQWEMSSIETPENIIQKKIGKFFEIKKTKTIKQNPYHKVWILLSKNVY